MTNRTPIADEAKRISISFRYLDTTHPSFSIVRCGTEYHRLLLSRFRELSSLTVQEFRVMRSGTLRIHRINFADPRVSERSFGVHAKLSADEKGWQFALSANEHGRVHGRHA